MVELALFLPVFFLITMATIETCRMLYLRQSLKIATYETARLGIVPNMTRETLEAQCDVILRGRNIQNYKFTTSPEDPSQLTYGQVFTTHVEISADENAIVGAWYYKNKILSESVSVMAEQ